VGPDFWGFSSSHNRLRPAIGPGRVVGLVAICEPCAGLQSRWLSQADRAANCALLRRRLHGRPRPCTKPVFTFDAPPAPPPAVEAAGAGGRGRGQGWLGDFDLGSPAANPAAGRGDARGWPRRARGPRPGRGGRSLRSVSSGRRRRPAPDDSAASDCSTRLVGRPKHDCRLDIVPQQKLPAPEAAARRTRGQHTLIVTIIVRHSCEGQPAGGLRLGRPADRDSHAASSGDSAKADSRRLSSHSGTQAFRLMTRQQPECAVGPTVGACVRAGLSLLWLLLSLAPQAPGRSVRRSAPTQKISRRQQRSTHLRERIILLQF